jgi:hypothetical protein
MISSRFSVKSAITRLGIVSNSEVSPLNQRQINASQELVGNGAQNLVSTFFSGYPSASAFSRTAINSKCGARTPLGGCKSIYVVKNVAYTKYRGSWVGWSVVIIIPLHPWLNRVSLQFCWHSTFYMGQPITFLMPV